MLPARMMLCAFLVFFTATGVVLGAETHVRVKRPDKVVVMTSQPDGFYMRLGADLQSLVDSEGDLRFLPVTGHGPVQNMIDVLEMPGVDAAIVPADVLSYMSREKIRDDLATRITFLAKLGTQDVHIITSTRINSIEDLRGKRVNLGSISDSRHITGSLLFSLLDIDIVATEDGVVAALQQIRSGQLDAVVFVGQKHSPLISALPPQEFKLIAIPDNASLEEIYSPDLLSSDDYPGQIKAGESLETLAVPVVLAAKDWKKRSAGYDRLAALVSTIFANAADLTKGQRYADWNGTNLAADVRGWTRATASRDWLAGQNAMSSSYVGADEVAMKVDFETFLSARGKSGETAASDSNQLYDEFVRWKKQGKP